MAQYDQFTATDSQEFQTTLRERGKIVVQGIEALRLLRREVDRTMYDAGLYVEWDPGIVRGATGVAGADDLVGDALVHRRNRRRADARRAHGASRDVVRGRCSGWRHARRHSRPPGRPERLASAQLC